MNPHEPLAWTSESMERYCWLPRDISARWLRLARVGVADGVLNCAVKLRCCALCCAFIRSGVVYSVNNERLVMIICKDCHEQVERRKGA